MAVHAQKFNRIPNVNGREIDFSIGVAHMPDITLCIAAGGGFEKRQPGGNDDLERDYKIIDNFIRKSHAPNQS